MPCVRELFLALVFSLILIFLLYQKFLARRAGSPEPKIKSFSSLTSITALLNPPRTTVPRLLQERAHANHRLAQTLNLTNTFVHADIDIHTKFVQVSRRLVKDAQSPYGWTRLQDICNQAVELSLDEYPSAVLSSSDKDIPFDHFIQIVVLRTILVGFLNIGKDIDELDIKSLGSVAADINKLWTQSKSPDNGSEAASSSSPSSSSSATSLSDDLQLHLRQLVSPESGFTNPINFVVPTWETMWRVCATIIARILADNSYEGLFQEFFHAEVPTSQKFDAPDSRHGFSVRDFVVECMRLNPPVKRISRIRNQTVNDKISDFFHGIFAPRIAQDVPVRMVADIEAVLRDSEIWSEDSSVFNPRRHLESPVAQNRSRQMQAEALKLVFGHGPLRCVAASWAPMAAAVFAATIMTRIRETGMQVVCGDKIGGRSGWDGWKIVKRSS